MEQAEAAAQTRDGSSRSSSSGAALEAREQAFFRRLDEDAAVAEEDAKAEADVVHGFERY